MDRKTAAKLLEEQLPLIYSWSFSKVYDKNEAEDLAQDIVYHVLNSVERLEIDDAFWGFVWKLAENVLRTRIRKRQRDEKIVTEGYRGTYWLTPEDEVIKSEEIHVLRRELSLLSSQYRNVTVQYYIYGKSCSQISAEQNISVEMVKYYLFKTRKILKEGIGMTREFGEKSYNPQVFRVDYWGSSDGSVYWQLFKRKLPGNIVLAAKDRPISMAELSVELGVAVPYLEEEVNILESYNLLKRMGDKYQTNIVIFTGLYEKCVEEKLQPLYMEMANYVNQELEKILPELTVGEFPYEIDSNYKKWVYTNIAMSCAAVKFNNEVICKLYGEYPLLANGSHGFVFGYNNDYDNHHFNGVYNYDEKDAWISINNYRIIEKYQLWKTTHWTKSMKAMVDAAKKKMADEENDELISLLDEKVILSKDGVLSANFAVFDAYTFESVKKKLTPIIEAMVEYMNAVCKTAEETLKDYVPKALKAVCGHQAYVQYYSIAAALVIEEMVRGEYLIMPNEKTNCCIFGVLK